jgi:magnesium-transporting ATPase (P-type)
MLFACAVELTLLVLLTQSTFRPVAMLLMMVASISFTWEVIPVRQPLISQLSRVANSPRFWLAVVGLIAVTVLTRRTFRRRRADRGVQKQKIRVRKFAEASGARLYPDHFAEKSDQIE